MTTAPIGPKGPLIEASSDRASFRWIIFYDISTDSISCRLDVKVRDKQHGEMFCIATVQPKTQHIKPDDPLIKPNKGVLAGEAVLVDRVTLINALIQLANYLRDAK